MFLLSVFHFSLYFLYIFQKIEKHNGNNHKTLDNLVKTQSKLAFKLPRKSSVHLSLGSP